MAGSVADQGWAKGVAGRLDATLTVLDGDGLAEMIDAFTAALAATRVSRLTP